MSRSPADMGIRTLTAEQWNLPTLVEAKGNQRIAVVIPARNEQDTVASVVRIVKDNLAELVDEVLVMDSLSTDETAVRAGAAGATVVSVADVRPDLGIRPGKGEALWKSLFVTDADLLVFIDADLSEWGAHFVTGLLGPLITDDAVMLVRGFYDRILDVGGTQSLEGGRVTELVARPWLARHRPELSDVIQPLAGEWAIRRSVFEALAVPTGYGVEMSTLLDVHAQWGSAAIVQVDLGRRAHRHQSLHDLGAMAIEVMTVADRRLVGSRDDLIESRVILRAPLPDRTWTERPVDTSERPPKRNIT